MGIDTFGISFVKDARTWKGSAAMRREGEEDFRDRQDRAEEAVDAIDGILDAADGVWSPGGISAWRSPSTNFPSCRRSSSARPISGAVP
jgi:hypothetical protein